ncbi:MAG: thioredoxin domain-containing protein, partial [Betaproteobacteria bacterium]|nr:thioredoxin domain-containing protein [Betaproteobacteria bacterium]
MTDAQVQPPNRLARETSPYLLQHAANPVDWYPWGEEALARARAEKRPILLSIGYSACHWCHVMAHESFEDPAVAAVMNDHFVNIKVDREERPDLDQIYQLAHQMLAHRPGGWPLTMFLTPDGTPFFGGTYFPASPRHGLPAFADLCQRMAAIYRERQKDIVAQSAALLEAFAHLEPAGGTQPGALDDAPLLSAIEALKANFDPDDGGFGSAPKFPHASDLELCLRHFATGAAGNAGRGRAADGDALNIVVLTLARMAEGGIFDHLGGGFCRYSTDAHWSIPHFEKMLYDNGPLLSLYADAWTLTQDPRFAQVVEATAGWLLRDMRSAEGAFYAALDADSEGEEGRFYVWTPQQVRATLTADESAVAEMYFGLNAPANFEGRHWHLRVGMPLAKVASQLGRPLSRCEALLKASRAKLLTARSRRIHPGLDDKILTSWNALAIQGLAHAGRIFGRDDWIEAAWQAFDFLRTRLWQTGAESAPGAAAIAAPGRLRASFKDGRASLNAYLDDYAFLLAAALELLQARFDAAVLGFAEALAGTLLAQFEDPLRGGFYFTSHDHEVLFHRGKPGHDNATPSGNGVAALAL